MKANGAIVASWLRWQGARCWAACGSVELIALALLMLWIGLESVVLAPLQKSAALLYKQVDIDQQQLANKPSQPVSAILPPVSAANALLEFLPHHAERETILKKLHDLAGSSGLALTRIDYHTETLPSLPVDKLGLRLSVQGAYPALREFLHDRLGKIPSLAVERIDFEASDKGPDIMTLSLDASLYLQQGEAGTKK